MNEKMITAWTVVAQGRVQGVFYRASTQKEATRLGLMGTVQNCSDGTVLIHVQGDPEKVDVLLQWAASGPPGARVDQLTKTPAKVDSSMISFEILR